MGLLDILNGMQNGPRGSSNPTPQAGGGMSPMTMAILALLAYKAVKHISGGQSDTTPAPAPSPAGSGMGGSVGGGSLGGGNLGGGSGGGLGDLLKGGLGGLLAGGAAGSVISGGLGDLLKHIQQSGQSPGPNKQIAPGDLASALGADQISSLMSQSGLSRDELLDGLSQHLPGVIDHLTPNGRLPTEDEVSERL
jgi:uncharacterized protein YidB (DUF937 family)